MDSRNGHLVATITQVGGSDEVWYDSNDPFCGGGQGCYYTASNRWTSNGLKGGSRTPVLGIIDAGTNTWLQNVATSVDSHSVAADPNNNHVYVPLDRSATDGGIGVFAGS